MSSNQETSAFYKDLTGSQPFFLLAGPNVIQSQEHCLKMARCIKKVADSLNIKFVFKASFDKANRTSPTGFRGPGLEAGLEILKKVKEEVGVPIITDIHESWQAEKVAEVADIIQIPAFLCRQSDLIEAAAKTGKVLHIKKGQWCPPSVVIASAAKSKHAGNPNVLLCDRGTNFGYYDLIVDVRNLEIMRQQSKLPITMDVTHALQQPASRSTEGGQVASGGLREMIPTVARAAVAAGINGIFMEVHDDPVSSPVDAPTQWPLRHLRRLLTELMAIANATRALENLQIDLTPISEEDFDFEAEN